MHHVQQDVIHKIIVVSYYVPVKHVGDGDSCEKFVKLDIEEQKKIAEKLDIGIYIGEIYKKLEDTTRNGLL